MSGTRGRTFSPAADWYRGKLPQQRRFARGKILEVAQMLADLGEEELTRDDKRRWWQRRRVRWQRVYDLHDAATTLRDAERQLRPDCKCLDAEFVAPDCPLHGDRQFREVLP